jgi:hypothetical protein
VDNTTTSQNGQCPRKPTLISIGSASDNKTTNVNTTAVLERIRSGALRERVLPIREKFASTLSSTNGDRKAAKAAIHQEKIGLPGALWSGTFSKRNKEALVTHSGLLCADLDALAEKLSLVRDQLLTSTYIWALFISPTGDGLKAIFRVQANAKRHTESFQAVEEHVRSLTGVQIDRACSDTARLCFLSYDPDVFLNESALELPPLFRQTQSAEANAKPGNNAEGRANPKHETTTATTARQKIAMELVQDIRWYSEVQGYGTCPGKKLHTTADGERDLRVHLDGAPNIFCVHESCKEVWEGVNTELQARIREAEYTEVIAETYFIEEKYWRKGDNAWRGAIKQNFADDLRVAGINARPSSKGDTASDVLRLMSRIRAERVLDAALPIVHDAREIIELNGKQVLNVSRIRAMQPAAEDDLTQSAWLHEFFDKIWDTDEPQQRDYFLAWFQRFYANALAGVPKSGQAIVIAGEPGIGKTFLSWRIVGKALGGFSDGSRFLKGETNFNKEIAEVPLLAIDDSEIADEVAGRNKFSSTVKKFVADPQITYHPKGVDEITIPCKNRIIITCNQDAHSLGVLPRLDTSIADKLMFFKLGSWQPNYKLPGEPEQYIANILPLWLRWLLDWKPPAYVLSENPRFGINPYKHPVLVGAVEEESAQATLKHMINRWFKGRENPQPEWMSARDLRTKLSCIEDTGNALAKELGGPRLGRTLSSLGPDYVLDKRTNKKNNSGEYLITSPEIDRK